MRISAAMLLRYRAFNEMATIPAEAVGPALRAALIEELERTNDLKELSRSTGIGFVSLESPDWHARWETIRSSVTDPASHYYMVNDGLRVLRLMIENQEAQPLDSVMDTRSCTGLMTEVIEVAAESGGAAAGLRVADVIATTMDSGCGHE